MSPARMRIACALVAVTAVGVAVSMASCSQTATNVTLHSFQQAQKINVVCIQVNDANGNAVAPSPVAENECAPVASGLNGATLQFHLYAVVTQTTPGALAVVDLTAGNVVDVDRSTPGVDFIPVGATPTDVAVTRDGQKTYVSSADPSKLAIYEIDNKRLLGNSTSGSSQRPPVLSELRSCALPQPPQALAIVPSTPSDGGPPGAYALVALLRAAVGMPAVVATIDPTSMAPGSLAPCSLLGATALSGQVAASSTPGPAWADGVPDGGAGDLRSQEPAPGPQCPVSGTTDAGLGGDDAVGMAFDSGDAGLGDASTNDAAGSDAANLGPAPPFPHPTSMALRGDTPLLYVGDDAVPVIHVIDLHDPTSPREIDPLLATSISEPTRRVAVGDIAISPSTRDYKVFVYAIDARQGTLMVYDVTDPSASPHVPLERPHPELNPFAPLDRIGFSAPVAAVAFVKHDWSLPSQVDAVHQYTGILCNPNPNAHPDAGVFLDRGAYYRPDQAALIESMVTNGGTVQTLPSRLRGVFGFATLSNGAVVTIDVDDWDAPCRRPDPMAPGYMTGALDIPQPASGDLDPYHAPFTNSASPNTPAVTLEAFFPVSAPHRLRSGFLLRNDSVVGIHLPNLVGAPQLFSATGAPVPMTGVGGATSPVLLPAPLPRGFIDPSSSSTSAMSLLDGGASLDAGTDGAGPSDAAPPSADPTHTLPGIRVSFDDPTVHQDQDWTVTYEGALPTVSGIAASITPSAQSSDPQVAYQTLTLSAPGAQFCARGVEDWGIGQARANQVLSEIGRAFPVPPSTFPTDLGQFAPTLPQWTSDYVEITDDLLPATDRYWTEPTETNDCWDGSLADPPRPPGPDGNPAASLHGQDRYNVCQQTFGAATDADTHLQRDLPILHAFNDSLEVGRFGWFPGDPSAPAPDGGSPDAGASASVTHEQTTNRVVVAADPSNAPFLRLTRCCFHHQAAFKVRTGGQWVAVGSAVGLLHHVRADPAGACVLSCEPRATLLNARAFDIPWWSSSACSPVPAPSFDRDSPLAMRNPMFSFVMWSGCPGTNPPTHDHTPSTRDMTWRFSTRGGFVPLTVQLTSPTTGNSVSPQSMRFIGSLGQLAVVDGESQGLVLIDLNLLAVAHNYF